MKVVRQVINFDAEDADFEVSLESGLVPEVGEVVELWTAFERMGDYTIIKFRVNEVSKIYFIQDPEAGGTIREETSVTCIGTIL